MRVVALTVLALILVSASAADAAFPGANGRIVFVSTRASGADQDGDLYTIRADGKRVMTLTANRKFELSPSWSPGGKRIAFSRYDRTYAIHVMRADGTGVRKVTSPPGQAPTWWKDFSPTWSPSGRRIAFVRQPPSPSKSYLAGELFVVNADGTGLRRLPLPAGEYGGLSWSPDGSRFAYLRQQHLYVVRADGSDTRQLFASESMLQGFDWSPDGKRIAVSVDLYPTHAILVGNVDGSGEDVLVPDVRAQDLAWSPDGRAIAFQTSDLRIAVADLTSGNVRMLESGRTQGADFLPDWQPTSN